MTLETVKDGLAGSQIDMLVMDADGRVDRDLQLYAPMLCNGALLVLNDYRNVVRRDHVVRRPASQMLSIRFQF